MDDTFKEIDAVLLPGMLEINVKEALEKAESLRVEMRESADLCKRLLDRLRFLRKYLPTRKSKLPSAADYPKVLAQFANTLGLVIRFFKSHSVKTLLQRIAANRLIIKQIEQLHGKIDGVFRAASLSNSTEMNEWKEHKVNDIAQLQRALEESSRNTSNLVGGLSGSALEEALTELQSEIDPLKNQHEFRVFLKRVLDTVVKHAPGAQKCRKDKEERRQKRRSKAVMANLRTAMDAAFWDLDISSPQTLHGAARAVPGDPFPLEGARASRALRVQQLSFLGNGFPLGIIPSFSPTSQKDLGSFSLQSLFLRPSTSNWWLGLTGQFRPKKLISSIKADLSAVDEWELSTFKEVAKHFIDKSLFSFGLCSQLSLTSASSLMVSTEQHGEKKGHRNRVMLFHQLPFHDITLEAAWPELFIDHKGRYWELPESISLGLSSLVSESGLRYRFGIHKNGGHPQSVNAINDEAPSALMPGLCAKAAFSYEKSRDLWRQREKQEDGIVKTERGLVWRPSYDIRLREPHAAISGIIGGTCEAWFGGSREHGDGSSADAKKRSPFGADLFASGCCTFQHGQFRKRYGDLTRVDARLNICSASALAKRVSNLFSSSVNGAKDPLSSPRLNLIFQQQVAGPIVFRVDSKLLLDSSGGRAGPQLEDFTYSLNYSLRLLRSGKVVAWYSPKRKEGMIELRLFEF